MKSDKKRASLIFIALNSSIALFTALFCLVFKPWRLIGASSASTCIFQNIFHFYCPACGGTRSVGYLFRLDLVRSFICYPPLFVLLALLVRIDVLLIKCISTEDLTPLGRARFYEFLLIPASILLCFLIRNALLFFGIDVLGDIFGASSFLNS